MRIAIWLYTNNGARDNHRCTPLGLVVGGIPGDMFWGFVIGLLSAAVLVIFTGMNKLLAKNANPLSTTCIEMAAGAIFTLLVIL